MWDLVNAGLHYIIRSAWELEMNEQNTLDMAVIHGHGGNRSGGVFVSRLSPNTSASTVRRHIKDSCGVDVKCMSIKTKYDSYCSFKVDCDESCMKRLLQPSVGQWVSLCGALYSAPTFASTTVHIHSRSQLKH